MNWATYVEYLQVVLKEFDSIAASNEKTLICYFQDSLCLSIGAQVDNRRLNLDAWEEMVEKVVNAKTKAGLQLHSMIREIDSRCPKKHRSLVKKDKDNTYQEHRDEASNKDKEKAKSHLLSSANQPQTQASKKNKCHGSRQDHPAAEVNATEVVKKDKNKAKDLSHIECYTCKQKGHYANKCPKKPKN